MRDSKFADELNKDKTFEEYFLSNILRNSRNICEHIKYNFGDFSFRISKLSTVLGYKPEVVKGDMDNPSYYKESIDAIKKKADKFICIREEKFNLSLKNSLIREKLNCSDMMM